jgi:putative oxidoreductase
MNAFASLHAYTDWGLLVLRLTLGATFIAHGKMKWGMWKMKPSAQLPAPMLGILRLLSICEPLGGIAVIAGFLTQLAGLGFAIVMLGALDYKIRTAKAPYMVTEKVGWEFELGLLASALVLLCTGAGAFGLDRALFNF